MTTQDLVALVDAMTKRIILLRQALEQIVETPAEVEIHGECAYCQSKSIARKALEDR